MNNRNSPVVARNHTSSQATGAAALAAAQTRSRQKTLQQLHTISNSLDINTGGPLLGNEPQSQLADPRLAARRFQAFIKELSSELELIESMGTVPPAACPPPIEEERAAVGPVNVKGYATSSERGPPTGVLQAKENAVAAEEALGSSKKPDLTRTASCDGKMTKRKLSYDSKLSSPYLRSFSEEADWTKFEKIFARDLIPAGGERETGEFLMQLVKLLFDYIKMNNDRSRKVLDFHHPHQLLEMMDHCLDVPKQEQPLEQVLSDCKETLKYCVRTAHPRFFNQLSTGLDVIALAGEWLTATANTNMFTYEIAPVFTLMESLLLSKMRSIIGWEEEGDGIFAPGGSLCNMYAVLSARYRLNPEAKTKGLYSSQPLVLFTSSHVCRSPLLPSFWPQPSSRQGPPPPDKTSGYVEV